MLHLRLVVLTSGFSLCVTVDRPFKVPLSTWGCAIALIPTLAALLLVIALASYTTIIFNTVTITVGILAYTLTRRCRSPSQSGQYDQVPLSQGFDV